MVPPTRSIACLFSCVFFLTPFFSYGQSAKKSDILNLLFKNSTEIGYIRFHDQPTPSKDLLILLERQAKWDDAGPGELNPLGLRLRFQKIDEKAMEGGRVATRYRVLADAAPEDKVFSFGVWPIGAKTFSLDPHDIYANGQGLLMIHRPKPEQEMIFKAGDDELEVTATTDPAEPMRYVLSRKDGQSQIFGTVVPHPVVEVDRGCSLELRVAQPNVTAVLILIDRFPAKTKIPLVLESEGESVSEVVNTDANGHAVIAGFPYVPGKTHGMLKASAEGPECLPSAVLPWGSAAEPAPKTP
ncbi:MAG: hypothetical protein ABSD67_19055 [Terracidiphilus sp.]|jgi:hypothetical protein